MVNVWVRSFQTPLVWVRRKVCAHIIVNLLLQIDPKCTKGADNNIRTNSCCGRHVTSRIRQAPVRRIVAGRNSDLRSRCGNEEERWGIRNYSSGNGRRVWRGGAAPSRDRRTPWRGEDGENYSEDRPDYAQSQLRALHTITRVAPILDHVS
jgi:hypothetical protein